ncbi:hypothetical protein DFP72DRAFT_912499 [Ephemerocybe angulata]|uniref:Protein YAE1 n=1 Tax=Ephemerocybe angulata TaxID=980116 RepID=A0A8H6HN73_9AGAR|nr:hypothetical protein DFP72DRAFT_912499 [Tulosesus angulatus]
MDSPWDEEISNDAYNGESHWQKIASDFTNAGYREGITAGKEGALQEGFDSGFAVTGAPLGRDIGRIRGISSALLALTNKGTLSLSSTPGALDELPDIAAQLADIRFSDIVPPDLEAEEHAREHMRMEGEALEMDSESEELKDKKDVEGLEDLLAGMSASGNGKERRPQRPTMQDFEVVKRRLEALVGTLGLQIQLS